MAWVGAVCDAVARSAALIAQGQDASFQNKVHLAIEAAGFGDKKSEDVEARLDTARAALGAANRSCFLVSRSHEPNRMNSCRMHDRLLVLVRHGQSDWNLKNLFTGWKDVDLSPKGVEEASAAGRRLKAQGLSFDVAFTSALIRAQNTLKLVLAELGQPNLPTTADQALNERDYGDLSGLNKDDARKKWGEEQVHIWRRSYDVAPPAGESLKDTVARVLPYYCQHILPAVLDGQRVLVAAHGNSLRALVMVLDRLTPKTIPSMELETGVPLVYRLKANSTVESKAVLGA